MRRAGGARHGAAELLDYGRDSLSGLVLEEAAATSHVAIVARSMGPAMVASLGRHRRLRPRRRHHRGGWRDWRVHLATRRSIVKAFEEKRSLRAQAQARFAAVRDLPAVTRDGVGIKLMMNAGLEFDMPHLEQSGADGFGLFRTELQFMIGETMPRLADQAPFYKKILDAAGDKPVVFRTLDLGGDKVLPYAAGSGRKIRPWLRAIRIALDRPALLRYQVRALLTASAGAPAHPAAHGFRRGRVQSRPRPGRPRTGTARLLNLVRPAQVLVGAMLEVPALAFMLPQLMRSADFVSIGSNDLLSPGLCGGPHQSARRQAL
jgi:phosphotransferase system enzyme I (PtsP)